MIMMPAVMEDLHAILRASDHRTLPKPIYKRFVVQLVFSECYAWRTSCDDTCPLAIGGVAPLPDGCGEVWFLLPPGGLGRALLGVVRGIQTVGKELAPSYPGGFVCFVRHGNAVGERLVSLLGFHSGDYSMNGYQLWRHA